MATFDVEPISLAIAILTNLGIRPKNPHTVLHKIGLIKGMKHLACIGGHCPSHVFEPGEPLPRFIRSLNMQVYHERLEVPNRDCLIVKAPS
jgi:hypothetical protein